MAGHKDSLAGADGTPQHGAAVTDRGTLGTRQGAIDHLLRQRPSKATSLVFGDEAGPCGAGRSRSLTTTGHACWGVAPSLMPQTAGARVQPARREAVPRARRARSGDLPGGSVPTVAADAMRDLTRARAETLSALKAATWRLHAFVLRHDLRDTGRATWSPAPRRWRADVVCPTPAPPLVWQDSVRAVHAPTARLPRLDQDLHADVTAWRLHPVVEALQALRGGQCPVAVTLVAASGALTRCGPPSELRNCLGLLPAASSSGERRQQGAMTTAGHTQARRALVAGAWACRDPAQVRRPLPRRLEHHPTMLQDSRGTAHVRRGQRSRRRMARGNHAHVGTVAMARELGGGLGAVAPQVPVTAEGHRADRPCTRTAAGCRRAAAEAPPRGGGPLGGVTRLVQETRASREAGTRRRPGRWSPPHGSPQAHPSSLTGSAAAAARKLNTSCRSTNVATTS